MWRWCDVADRRYADEIDALAARFRQMEQTLRDLSTQPMIIPVLNADPGTGYQGNIWAYPDGKLNVRLKDGSVKQYSPVAPVAATASNPTPPPQPVTRQNTWVAQWGQAYRAAGGQTGADNSKLYQGNGDTYNGRQRSLVGFDYASIASALSGSNVTGVEFWIDVRHTWWGSGATAWLGLHNNAAKPGSWTGTIGRDFISSFGVPNSGSGWYSVSTEFGSRIRDGSAKGVTLQAPNDDRAYYLYASGGPGTGSDRMPQLRITYVK
jgi:hypothetical protein